MLREVLFYGPMADRLGVQSIKLDVNNPQQLVRALISQVKGYRAAMIEFPYVVTILENSRTREFVSLCPDTLKTAFGDADRIYIAPQIYGAWEAAAALASYFASAGSVAYYAIAIVAYVAIAVAVSYAASAIMQALGPSPQTTESNEAQRLTSFLYNGAQNVIQQGYAVPLVYGTHTVGSIVISAGTRTEDLAIEVSEPETNPSSPPAEDWQWGNDGA